MSLVKKDFTRRDFIKTTGTAAIGLAVGLPAVAQDETTQKAASRVILIRDKMAVNEKGEINSKVVARILDEAVRALSGKDKPADAWAEYVSPDDIVGIKTNVWAYLPTGPAVENAIKNSIMSVGVKEKNIGISDRGVLGNSIFENATALINARPMRTHSWSGVGSLIKNYIMFVPRPYEYHDNACANLASIWDKPIVRGKTRLNILVLLTPQFHNVGPHHFDRKFVWTYGGLAVSTDPVAADAVGLKIIQAKRQLHFGDNRPIKPNAHHIEFADKKFDLGNADMNNINLIKMGWKENILI